MAQSEGDALYWPIFNLDLKNPNAKVGLEHADPKDLIAAMRSHEAEVMRLLGEIEALVAEVQALAVPPRALFLQGALRNPANDAKLMARTLKQLGFEVMLAIDADQKTMKRHIRDFGAALTAVPIALRAPRRVAVFEVGKRHPFETLRTAILPGLIARRSPGQNLAVWCAACSSGKRD